MVAGACALGAAMISCGQAPDPGVSERPVITPSEAWNGHPTAEVDGVLKLRRGCLLLNGEVVFWPKGTGWDPTTRAVTFDGLPAAPVGEIFRGGGGYYDSGTDFESWLGHETGSAIEGCLSRTNASGVVFAYAS